MARNKLSPPRLKQAVTGKPQAMPKNMPAVSVIMPLFNHARFVGMAIESILNQGFKDFELIVVDDGSTDGGAEVVKKYLARDKRVKLHQQQNAGVGAARNIGVSMAQGIYVAWQDADDFSHPARLQWQYDFLQQHHDIAGATTSYDVVDRHHCLLSNPAVAMATLCNQPVAQTMIHYFKKSTDRVLAKTFGLSTFSMMIRKECYDKVGGYRHLRFGEDKDMFWRLQEHYQLVEINSPAPPLYFMRNHGDYTKQRLKKKFAGQFNIWLGHFIINLSCYARRVYGRDPLDKIPIDQPIARLRYIFYFIFYPRVFYYYFKNKFYK